MRIERNERYLGMSVLLAELAIAGMLSVDCGIDDVLSLIDGGSC
jgi:hypothetical protein